MSEISEEKALKLLKSNKESGRMSIEDPEKLMEQLKQRYGEKAPDLVYRAIMEPTKLMDDIGQKGVVSARALEYLVSDNISKEDIKTLGAEQVEMKLSRDVKAAPVMPEVKLEGKIENLDIKVPEPEPKKKKGSWLRRIFHKKKKEEATQEGQVPQGKVETLPKEAITNSDPMYLNEGQAKADVKIELAEVKGVEIKTPEAKFEGKLDNVDINIAQPIKMEIAQTTTGGYTPEYDAAIHGTGTKTSTQKQVNNHMQGLANDLKSMGFKAEVVSPEELKAQLKNQNGEYPPKAPTSELQEMQTKNDQQMSAAVDAHNNSQQRTTEKGVKYTVTEDGMKMDYSQYFTAMEVDRLMPKTYHAKKEGIFAIGPARGQNHAAAHAQAREELGFVVGNQEIYNDMKQRQSNGEQLTAAETKFMEGHEKDLKKWNLEIVEGKGLVQTNPARPGPGYDISSLDVLDKRVKNDIKSEANSDWMQFRMQQAQYKATH